MKMIIGMLIVLTGYAFGTLINVPADQPTIQQGIDSAVEGDTVLVASGTYFENIIWPEINGIKLIGSGQDDCIIDGNNQASVFTITPNILIGTATVISGFTVQNGKYTGL